MDKRSVDGEYNLHMTRYNLVIVTQYLPFFTLFSNSRYPTCTERGFPGGLVVKNPQDNARSSGDTDWILASGRSPREGSGNPLQYSCLGNPMGRGAWRATVHGVTKLNTTEHAHAHKGCIKIYSPTFTSININNCTNGDLWKCQFRETTHFLKNTS